jgi:hypothetical protein
MLGDSIEKIALVKAGIMKPGCPVLVGPGCPIDVLKVRHITPTLNLFSPLLFLMSALLWGLVCVCVFAGIENGNNFVESRSLIPSL